MALARLGVGVLLVERKSEVLALPRATVVSTRSLEVLRSWGLQAAVAAGAAEVEWKMRMSETLAQVAEGMSYDVGFPSSDQSALISPVAPACVPQDHLEQVLLAISGRCRQPGSSSAPSWSAWPTRPTACGQSYGTSGGPQPGRYPRATSSRPTAPTAQSARELGIAMTGEEGALQGALVQFRAPALGPRRQPSLRALRGDPTGRGGRLPAGRPGRPLALRPHDRPGEGGVPDPSPRDLARLIRVGAGIADLDVQVERIGRFSSAAQVAERWRAGKVFLVGDAAHRVTPRGGTGMNTALLGGYDLGWKLAWVLRGWATEALLDTYEEERRPAAEHNVARSADEAGSQGRRAASSGPTSAAGSRTTGCPVDRGRRSTCWVRVSRWSPARGRRPGTRLRRRCRVRCRQGPGPGRADRPRARASPSVVRCWCGRTRHLLACLRGGTRPAWCRPSGQ